MQNTEAQFHLTTPIVKKTRWVSEDWILVEIPPIRKMVVLWSNICRFFLQKWCRGTIKSVTAVFHSLTIILTNCVSHDSNRFLTSFEILLEICKF